MERWSLSSDSKTTDPPKMVFTRQADSADRFCPRPGFTTVFGLRSVPPYYYVCVLGDSRFVRRFKATQNKILVDPLHLLALAKETIATIPRAAELRRSSWKAVLSKKASSSHSFPLQHLINALNLSYLRHICRESSLRGLPRIKS